MPRRSSGFKKYDKANKQMFKLFGTLIALPFGMLRLFLKPKRRRRR